MKTLGPLSCLRTEYFVSVSDFANKFSFLLFSFIFFIYLFIFLLSIMPKIPEISV